MHLLCTQWRLGCMNLREHLFASSHEADIYTRRFFFLSWNVTQYSNDKLIDLFFCSLCIAHSESMSIKMHSCILFSLFFLFFWCLLPGCTETTTNGINSKRTQIINQTQHMPRVKPLRNWMKTRARINKNVYLEQNGTIWARTWTQSARGNQNNTIVGLSSATSMVGYVCTAHFLFLSSVPLFFLLSFSFIKYKSYYMAKGWRCIYPFCHCQSNEWLYICSTIVPRE